jgi:hypothetical protein
MSSLVWVALVALLVLAAVFTGAKPRGTRSVASTRLMTAGTMILAIVVVIAAVMYGRGG